MTHIIAEPCIGTKDTACVEVCPVDCIHPTNDSAKFTESEMLYIDPDTCIDRGLYVDECPVQAIFPRGSAKNGRSTYRSTPIDSSKTSPEPPEQIVCLRRIPYRLRWP